MIVGVRRIPSVAIALSAYDQNADRFAREGEQGP
jgi:hypothetical protein